MQLASTQRSPKTELSAPLQDQRFFATTLQLATFDASPPKQHNMEKSSKGADQRKPRTVYALDNPFCQVQWPVIEKKEDQELILELLCALLSPIGNHRRLHKDPISSKGKRSKRFQREARKRMRLESGTAAVAESDSMSIDGTELNKTPTANEPVNTSQKPDNTVPPPPPPPEVSSHVKVGLNSITTHLSALAASNLPPTPSLHKQHCNGKGKQITKSPAAATKPDSTSTTATTTSFTAIFLTRADSQPSPLHAHLPVLTYIASSSLPNPTLLIPLPRGACNKLQTALDIPSVNFVGLLSTLPESGTAGALLQLVRRIVKPIQVPWLEGKLSSPANDAILQPPYQPLKVKKLRTTVGPPKQKAPQPQKAEK